MIRVVLNSPALLLEQSSGRPGLFYFGDTVAKKEATKHPLMANDQAWNKELVMEYLCEQTACSSAGLATILAAGCNGLTLPDYTTIDRWLSADEQLRQRYARAKEAQADYMADEMMQIADTTTDPQKARLQLDTRKWLAAKLKPKKYGEKQEVEHKGSVTLVLSNDDSRL
jgi:hypothetical protein